MTYLGFLILFVMLPALLLGIGFRHLLTERWWRYTALLSLIAVVWTTPWDNYLVANNVWWYDPDKVLGIILGYVPVEEYAFFVAQTILTSILLCALWYYLETSPRPFRILPLYSGLIILLPFLILVIIALATGNPQWHYFVLEVGWLALLPVAIQYLWGFDILLHYWRLWLTGVLIPTIWLSAMDAYAIHEGIWTIDPAQTLGIKIGGVLPLEELIFFAITNLLIVQGMILFMAPESWQRVQRLQQRYQSPASHEGQTEA